LLLVSLCPCWPDWLSLVVPPAREAATARAAADLDLAAASRLEAARKAAAAELAEERGALAGARSALEVERARVLDMRQAATAEMAVVAAKEDRWGGGWFAQGRGRGWQAKMGRMTKGA
jgi:hypothetical protein